MSKREANTLAAQGQGIDIDAPRAKRHKPASATPLAASPPRKGKESQQQQQQQGASVKEEGDVGKEGAGEGEEREMVREKGMKLWQTVKDAVNKEGRTLSNDFLRLPSKRQYADYYKQIKAPVSLDEIRQKIETKAYPSFDEVRQDLERCFRNAKRYNMKDSQIWKDAKHLHKLVIKEAAALSGTEVPAEAEDVANAEDHATATGQPAAGPSTESVETGEKKKPNMKRLLTSRLDKLVKLTDSSGRIRSTEFMELPNKKKWPIYYKTIKKPQCLENIYKKLNRREYRTASDFANDVELVFSNALEFNQEHSEVWEDAIALRDYFRQLMSDLPPPYTIPAYASPDHSTKIKLKKPKPEITAATTTIPVANTTTPGTLLLRLPGQHVSPVQASSSATPQVPVKLAPSPKPQPSPAIPTHSPPTTTATSVVTTPGMGALQPAKFTQTTTTYGSSTAQNANYYPNASYQQPRTPAVANALPNTNNIHPYVKPVQPQPTHQASPARPLHLQTRITPAPAPTTATTPAPIPTTTPAPYQITPASAIAPAYATNTFTSVRTPTPTTPVTGTQRQLRSVSLRVLPSGRRIELSYRDGVRIWALRLANADTGVWVGVVKFLVEEEEEEEESEEGEDRAPEEEEEEEEEEEAGSEVTPPKKAKGGQRKGKNAKLDAKGKGKAVAEPGTLKDEVLVKLNGVPVTGQPGTGKENGWNLELGVGTNLLEIGEKGVSAWKVYLERSAA